MNFSAKLKANQQPNYIFNFNIDIPIKYKSSITHRSNPTSPAKSPGKLTQKRYKLSSITPRPIGTTCNAPATKKVQKSGTKSNKKNQKIPKTMKEQFLQKDLYQINTFNSSKQEKKPQASISRKTQKITTNSKKLSQNEEICPSRRTVKHPYNNNNPTTNNTYDVTNNITTLHNTKSTTLHPSPSPIYPRSNITRNISILQKLITDEHNIKYPTDSSQIKKTEPSLNLNLNNLMNRTISSQQQKINLKSHLLKMERVETLNDDIDMLEIRQFEEISTQRKERLNYEYLKEKILLEASVRKIQRAWRNYLTKKLVNCYSSTLSARFMKKELITSARSQPKALNIMKQRKPFNSNDLFQLREKEPNADNLLIQRQQKLKHAQNEESSSNSCSQQSDCESDFESRKVIQRKHETRPFTKKPSVHDTGKSEATKFFQTDLPKKQISPRVVLPRPSSPSKNQPQKISLNLPQPNKRPQSPPSVQSIASQLRPTQSPLEQQSIHQREREIEQKLKKFQEEEIRKWESILDSIKKGKNIEVLLEKSEKYKRELENNMKKQEINLQAINQNRASPILFRQKSSKSSLSSLHYQQQQQKTVNLAGKQPEKVSIKSPPQQLKTQSEQSHDLHPNSASPQQSPSQPSPPHNSFDQTAQKRRQKIMFFENEILKIDNQEYSDVSSASCQSFTKFYSKAKCDEDLEQREKEENIKLRKKLELFNTHFLDISSNDQGLTDRSLKGLKGSSMDQRRNSIVSKRFSSSNSNTNDVQQQQKDSQNPLAQSKQPPSSEQSRANRRPDIVITTNPIKKDSKPFSKIQQLINRKIEYPEESQTSSPESSLEIQNTLLITPENDVKRFNQMSDDSSNDEDMPNFNGHQKHFLQHSYFEGEPVMTHRERKIQVPELKLESLPKKFPSLEDSKKNDDIMINLGSIQQKIANVEILSRPKQQLNGQISEQKPIQKSAKLFRKLDMQETLKICSFIEEQLVYEGLLEFSDSNKIVQGIKGMFDTYKKGKKKVKPEGICTNLESIKDYLENFVGFMFENKLTDQVQKYLWTPSGPQAFDLLRYLRKDSDYDNDSNEYIMGIELFEKHWKYANSNIYFDRKYSDQKMEQQRVAYLKGLTRVYFRSIFDAFNESLEFQRSYGLTGKPYPWSSKVTKQQKKSLKTACQLAYRRILKISVVYYGVHFDDKSHLFNQEEIKELQEERLLTLLMMELEEDEYRWQFTEDEMAETKYDVAFAIEQIILEETLREVSELQNRRIQQLQTLIN